MNYEIYNETNAPEKSQPMLKAVKEKYSFVPNLMGVLAEAPHVLESYMQLGDQLSQSTFTAEEIQVLYLAVNYEHDCHYCMAAHSTVAMGMKMPAHILEALRTGKDLDSPKLNAVATIARKAVQTRGWLEEGDIQNFLAAGFTKANVLDVILGVAHKTVSNYVNHINVTPVDDAFKSQEWKKS